MQVFKKKSWDVYSDAGLPRIPFFFLLYRRLGMKGLIISVLEHV